MDASAYIGLIALKRIGSFCDTFIFGNIIEYFIRFKADIHNSSISNLYIKHI